MKALTAAVRYIAAQPAGSLAGCAPALLLVLADIANDDGRAFPSLTTLGRRVNRGERVVRRTVLDLVRAGVINGSERRGTTTMYDLTPVLQYTPEPQDTPEPGYRTTPEPQDTPPRHQGSGAPGTAVPAEPSLTLTEPEGEPTHARASQAVTAPDAFEEFWAAYPRRTDKKRARAAWAKALRSHDATQLVQWARAFAADPNLPESQFVPHPSTWLNGERWTDLPLPARHQPQTAQQAVQSKNLRSLERNVRAVQAELSERERAGIALLDDALAQERRQIGGR